MTKIVDFSEAITTNQNQLVKVVSKSNAKLLKTNQANYQAINEIHTAVKTNNTIQEGMRESLQGLPNIIVRAENQSNNQLSRDFTEKISKIALKIDQMPTEITTNIIQNQDILSSMAKFLPTAASVASVAIGSPPDFIDPSSVPDFKTTILNQEDIDRASNTMEFLKKQTNKK